MTTYRVKTFQAFRQGLFANKAVYWCTLDPNMRTSQKGFSEENQYNSNHDKKTENDLLL
jgi:hypothetical protein